MDRVSIRARNGFLVKTGDYIKLCKCSTDECKLKELFDSSEVPFDFDRPCEGFIFKALKVEYNQYTEENEIEINIPQEMIKIMETIADSDELEENRTCVLNHEDNFVKV